MARCPYHRDRAPSLSIGKGRLPGKTVVYCFAGCRTEDVLASRGLKLRDLNADTPKNWAAIKQEEVESAKRQREKKRYDRVGWQIADRHRRLSLVLCSLARRAMLAPEGPDGDALAKVAHRACRMLGATQDALGIGADLPIDKPARVGLWCSLFPEPTDEQVEAEKVWTEEQMLHFTGTGHAEPHPPAPEPWQWSPTRAPCPELGHLERYEAALDTLEELKALRSGARRSAVPCQP